jgi:hypothetical protein
MVFRRQLAIAAWTAIVVLCLCAPARSQMLRILPEAELTGAEIELEPIPTEPPLESEGPWSEDEQQWAESEIAAESDAYAEEGYVAPHHRHRGRLRSRLAHSRHDAAELYERLRAPERTQSWTNRPLSIGGFVGGVFGTDLVGSRVSQEPGFFTGGRLGWDMAETWGLETRIGLAEMNLRGVDDSVFLDKNELFVWDADLMYYPWGESRLRPFLTVGLGFQQTDFVDDTGYRAKDMLFAIPFGMGFKYRVDQRIALRFELQDNFAFAGGHDIDSQNNISITGGFELRFGGRKKNYWPWDPSRTWW